MGDHLVVGGEGEGGGRYGKKREGMSRVGE